MFSMEEAIFYVLTFSLASIFTLMVVIVVAFCKLSPLSNHRKLQLNCIRDLYNQFFSLSSISQVSIFTSYTKLCNQVIMSIVRTSHQFVNHYCWVGTQLGQSEFLVLIPINKNQTRIRFIFLNHNFSLFFGQESNLRWHSQFHLCMELEPRQF